MGPYFSLRVRFRFANKGQHCPKRRSGQRSNLVDSNGPAHPAPPAHESEIEGEVEAIYEGYSAELLSYAATYVRREDSAVDAVQEVFLRYFVERRYGRRIENPRAWLYRVLRNYLLDRLDRAALTREFPGEVRDVPDPSQSLEATLARAQMAKQFTSQFSARELECLRLRAGGASYEEIASTMGIRSGTVSSLLTRVHKKLRTSIQDKAHAQSDTIRALTLLIHWRSE